MDFNTVYAQKLTTADRVAALVKDDDWVDYGWAIGTLSALTLLWPSAAGAARD